MKLGNTDINKIYLGNNEINKIYIGNTIVHEIRFITIQTTSKSTTWTPTLVTNSGDILIWEYNGTIITSNNPVFNLSGNLGTATITIKSYSLFAGFIEFYVDNLAISSIDILAATDLVRFSCKGDYTLSSLDISTLIKLEYLTFRSQNLTGIDLSANINLVSLWGYSNFLTTIDLSANSKLLLVYLYTNDLDSIKLDAIINDLDSHGLSNGDLKIVSNSGNLTNNAQPSYNNLISKNWIIDVSAPPLLQNDSPQIYNFNVTDGQPTRVYFNSSKIIQVGVNGDVGFIIEGRTITGVTINTGSTSGHYFTLSLALNFWDNILIRYEGGSDMRDLDGALVYPFTLQYDQNNIEEPTSSTIRYAAATTQGAGNGLNEANAWSYVNAGLNASSGMTVMMLAGQSSGNMIISNSGIAGSPIKFIGYNNAGKDVNRTRSIGMVFDNTIMPLFKNGSGDAIIPKNYVIIRNIQIENYPSDSIVLGNNSYQLLDNIYMSDCDHGTFTNNDDEATNQMVINSFARDMKSNGIIVASQACIIDNCWGVTSKTVGMDYYLNINGSEIIGHSYNSSIRNSYVYRDAVLENPDIGGHTGHGISLQARWNVAQTIQRLLKYALVENNEVVNCTNGGVELRYSGVTHNVVRNVLMRGEDQHDNYVYNFKGVTFNEDAAFNIVEDCTFKNLEAAIKFKDSPNDLITDQSGGNDNKVINCSFDDVKIAIETNAPLVNQRNQFINCTFNNVQDMFRRSQASGVSYPVPNWLDNTNDFINNIFVGVANFAPNSTPDPNFTYSDFFSNGFTMPTGTGNIAVDPQLDVNLKPTVNTPVSIYEGGTSVGVEYDKDGVERITPYGMGAYEKNV